MSIVPFEGKPPEVSSALVLHRLGPAEVLAFGAAGTLDLLGQTKDQVDRPFVDAMRTAIAAAPQLQGAVDSLTGRVVRLTAEGARLLRDNESMRTALLTGVVRNPETGRIAGHLTFVDPQSLAGLASSLPSIAGGAAMQLQLARIEKALDGLKQDLAYLIRHEHVKVESAIEANLKIFGDVYSTSRRRETGEDDRWTASPTSSTRCAASTSRRRSTYEPWTKRSTAPPFGFRRGSLGSTAPWTTSGHWSGSEHTSTPRSRRPAGIPSTCSARSSSIPKSSRASSPRSGAESTTDTGRSRRSRNGSPGTCPSAEPSPG